MNRTNRLGLAAAAVLLFATPNFRPPDIAPVASVEKLTA